MGENKVRQTEEDIVFNNGKASETSAPQSAGQNSSDAAEQTSAQKASGSHRRRDKRLDVDENGNGRVVSFNGISTEGNFLSHHMHRRRHHSKKYKRRRKIKKILKTILWILIGILGLAAVVWVVYYFMQGGTMPQF